MDVSQSVPELIAAARAEAKASEICISEILKVVGQQGVPDAQIEELRAATVTLELLAVDIFSLFEARMQHHFRRGPFSRKLKSLLLDAQQTDLADRFHQYYLAINVLKHGKGASYRELLNAPSSFLVVKQFESAIANVAPAPTGLVDVTVPNFFDGLATTILDAHRFLESR